MTLKTFKYFTYNKFCKFKCCIKKPYLKGLYNKFLIFKCMLYAFVSFKTIPILVKKNFGI